MYSVPIRLPICMYSVSIYLQIGITTGVAHEVQRSGTKLLGGAELRVGLEDSGISDQTRT